MAAAKAREAVLPPGLGWWKKFWATEPENDVVFFVTRNPALVQMRFGNALGLQAQYAELDVGAGYSTIQSRAGHGSVPELVAAVGILRRLWTPREDIPRWRRWFLDFARTEVQQIVSLVDYPDLEKWNRFTGVVARWFAVSAARSTTSAPLWLCFLFLCGWIIEQILTAGGARLGASIGRLRGGGMKEGFWQSAGRVGGLVCFTVFFAVPGLELLLLAFSGRTEDKLAIEALTGSVSLAQMSPLTGTFSFWAVVGLSLLVFVCTTVDALIGKHGIAAYALYDPDDQRLLYRSLSPAAQGELKFTFEALHAATEQSLDERNFEVAPYSTLRDGLIAAGWAQSLRMFLMLCIFPAYLAAWFVLSTVWRAITAIIRLPKLKRHFEETERIVATLKTDRERRAAEVLQAALTVQG
ncbi:MAG TPA: hypothetical protein VF647_07640 [Longimicrobium sp.]